MGRKPRILYDGAVYHVIQRGNNRAYIFNDQLDKAQFCDILVETKGRAGYEFSLLYYVLMDNHYHLIVETPTTSIDRIMHRVNMMYARYFNKKYVRTGSLYDGRYTGSLILDSRYLMSAIRYIAYNPVRAGLVKTPADYRWSAHLDIISRKKGLVDVDSLLSKFSSNPERALADYVALIGNEAPPQEDGKSTDEEKHKNLEKAGQKRMTSLEAMLNRQFPDPAIRKLVVSSNRSYAISSQRGAFVELAFHGGFYVKEIAALLNMTPRSVRYILAARKSVPRSKLDGGGRFQM